MIFEIILFWCKQACCRCIYGERLQVRPQLPVRYLQLPHLSQYVLFNSARLSNWCLIISPVCSSRHEGCLCSVTDVTLPGLLNKDSVFSFQGFGIFSVACMVHGMPIIMLLTLSSEMTVIDLLIFGFKLK